MVKEDKYTLEVVCKNCGNEDVIELDKGTEFRECDPFFHMEGSSVACGNCGCKKLVRG